MEAGRRCLLGQELKGEYEIWYGLPGVGAEGWKVRSHRGCPMSGPPRTADLISPRGIGHSWEASSHTLFPSPGPLPLEAVSGSLLSLAPIPARLGQRSLLDSPCPRASCPLCTSPSGLCLPETCLSLGDKQGLCHLVHCSIPASGTGLINSRHSLCVCGRHLCWRNTELKGAAGSGSLVLDCLLPMSS